MSTNSVCNNHSYHMRSMEPYHLLGWSSLALFLSSCCYTDRMVNHMGQAEWAKDSPQ